MNTQSNKTSPKPPLSDALPSVPASARWFLRWYCPASLADEIEGDLEEMYHDRLEEKGQIVAKLNYFWDVLRFCRPYLFRTARLENKKRAHLNRNTRMGLGANSYRVSIRNMMRNRGFTSLNLAGLAVGFASCFIILLYVQYEESFDGFHENSDRIVRVYGEVRLGAEPIYSEWTAHPVADFLESVIPEVEMSSRSIGVGTTLIKSQIQTDYEENILFADNRFLEIFDFGTESLNAQSPLAAPYTAVVTRSFATKYFGSEDVVGQVLTASIRGTEYDYAISGVISSPPENSSIQFDALFSYASMVQMNLELYNQDLENTWNATVTGTWLLLRPGSDWQAINEKVTNSIHSLAVSKLEEGASESDIWYSYYIQPLNDVHLGRIGLPILASGDPDSLDIFVLIAFFVLAIACVNYMNLSTARGATRAREVGVRKMVGAARGQLALQFVGESILMSTSALLLSILLVFLALPFIENLTAEAIVSDGWFFSNIMGWMILTALATGIIAGSYPAFVLSSFRPISVLKGSVLPGSGRALLRKMLVVGQFACGIALITSTLIVSNQLNYVQSKQLGFDTERIVTIPLRDVGISNRSGLLRDQVLAIPGVEEIAFGSQTPASVTSRNGVAPVGAPSEERMVRKVLSADENYGDALGLTMVSGRWFSSEVPTDNTTYILNEAAAKVFGLEDPLGTELERNGKKGTVIGVVKDFHIASLHTAIEPLVIYHSDNATSRMAVVRLGKGDLSSALEEIEGAWSKVNPGSPFAFSFLDAELNELYASETRLNTIFGIFSALGIFVSCLGLVGLAAFTAQRRRREIGVRKALGASSRSLIFLLSKEFILLVLISVIVASPISWIVMQNWLDGFAFHSEPGFVLLLIPGVLAIAVAFITVAGQAIKASRANPVYALRSE